MKFIKRLLIMPWLCSFFFVICTIQILHWLIKGKESKQVTIFFDDVNDKLINKFVKWSEE